MRKIFIVLAAVAAMVGCSKENTPADVIPQDNFTINASIEVEDTRVTVGGENFTEVSWKVGDMIRLESDKGYKGDLTATDSGRTAIKFKGDAYPVATSDTYYAVYPSSNISDAKVTFYLDNQPGDDVAALVAKAENVKSNNIDMTFKPVNSLLHVSVSGVSSLTKAEFYSYTTGKTLPETFTYDYTEDSITTNGSRASYEVTNPSAEGFFFSLPADLDMSEGYVVRLTDTNGNVCTKAYVGKKFVRASTTRVDFEWTTPTVTLGAKTSYSYYLAGYPATANSCKNTDIFFVTGKNGESCASSYAGVQDAMITDLGYEVDGATYTYSAGQVSWDKAANTFCINEAPSYSTDWGEKTGIKAFVVVEGKKVVYSTNTVWLTGLPYDYNFVDGSLDKYRSASWSTNGSLRVANQSQVGHDKKLVLYSNLGLQTANGYIVSPEFFVPNNVDIQPQIVRNVYASSGGISQTGYVGAVSSKTSKNTSSVSFTDKGTADYSDYRILGKNSWLASFQISPSNRYISISCTDNGGAICHYFLFEAHFRYAE